MASGHPGLLKAWLKSKEHGWLPVSTVETNHSILEAKPLQGTTTKRSPAVDTISQVERENVVQMH